MVPITQILLGTFENCKNNGPNICCINDHWMIVTPSLLGSAFKYSCTNNQAPGTDGVAYEVIIKSDICVQSLVYPIHKSPNSDPRIPLNYRDISFLSVIGKQYTAALNVRLGKYTESNDFIDKEQNGFRANILCLGYISVLHNVSTIRNLLRITYFVLSMTLETHFISSIGLSFYIYIYE